MNCSSCFNKDKQMRPQQQSATSVPLTKLEARDEADSSAALVCNAYTVFFVWLLERCMMVKSLASSCCFSVICCGGCFCCSQDVEKGLASALKERIRRAASSANQAARGGEESAANNERSSSHGRLQQEIQEKKDKMDQAVQAVASAALKRLQAQTGTKQPAELVREALKEFREARRVVEEGAALAAIASTKVERSAPGVAAGTSLTSPLDEEVKRWKDAKRKQAYKPDWGNERWGVRVSGCVNAFFLHAFDRLDLVAPPVCMLLSAFMQVCLPVFVLLYWIRKKEDGESVTAPEIVQLFWASRDVLRRPPPPPQLLPQQPPYAPWQQQRREIPSFETRFMKGIVATYILCYVMLKDYKCLYRLLLQAIRLYDAQPLPVIWCRRLVVVLTFLECIVYAGIVALVYIVSLILVRFSTTPKDVMLSGVGALFVLEIDDVIVALSNGEFSQRARRVIEDNDADDLTKCLEGWKALVFVASVWSFVLYCVAMWVAFLVSITR